MLNSAYNWLYGNDQTDKYKKQQDDLLKQHQQMLNTMKQQTQEYLNTQNDILVDSRNQLIEESKIQLKTLVNEQKRLIDNNKEKYIEYLHNNNKIEGKIILKFVVWDCEYGKLDYRTVSLKSSDPEKLANKIYKCPKDYIKNKLGYADFRVLKSLDIISPPSSHIVYKMANYLGINYDNVSSIKELEILINNHISFRPDIPNKGYLDTKKDAINKGMKE